MSVGPPIEIERISPHGQWSSRLGFLLVATASAISLSNVLRFPYLVDTYGGGAFLSVYVLCLLLFGVPLMMVEVMLGRRGRQSPVNSLHTVAKEAGADGFWRFIGWFALLAAVLILSFYSVIAGWLLAYGVRTGAGTFAAATQDGVEYIYAQLLADPERMLAWHTVFLVLPVIIVARGVGPGLEKSARLLVPAMFVLLTGLVVYALVAVGPAEAVVRRLFVADFGKLSLELVFEAMALAFYTLGIGIGAVLMFGSYLSRYESVGRNCAGVAILDLLFSLAAGLLIFALLMGHDLSPQPGTAMAFKLLPQVFGHMPYGDVFGALFYLLLVLAAWTSAAALLEPLVAWVVERRGITRVKAAVWVGVGIWILGVVSLLSLSLWADYRLLGERYVDLVELVAVHILVPLGGLAMVVMMAWVFKRTVSLDELRMQNHIGFRCWFFLVRYLVPLAMLAVILHKTGLSDLLLKSVK